MKKSLSRHSDLKFVDFRSVVAMVAKMSVGSWEMKDPRVSLIIMLTRGNSIGVTFYLC